MKANRITLGMLTVVTMLLLGPVASLGEETDTLTICLFSVRIDDTELQPTSNDPLSVFIPFNGYDVMSDLVLDSSSEITRLHLEEFMEAFPYSAEIISVTCLPPMQSPRSKQEAIPILYEEGPLVITVTAYSERPSGWGEDQRLLYLDFISETITGHYFDGSENVPITDSSDISTRVRLTLSEPLLMGGLGYRETDSLPNGRPRIFKNIVLLCLDEMHK